MRKRKKNLMLKVLVTFISFAFVTAGFAARIVPSTKVSIIKDGKVIGELSQEAPLPEGAILRCETRCAVKLDDVYMVAEPGTIFSVSPMANRHDVLVQQGNIYYLLNESSRPLHFDTPAGEATTRDFSMTDGELRAYVHVAGNYTEIGVIGGGSMTVATEAGEVPIATGKNITISLADSGKITDAAGGPEGLSRNAKIGLGAAGAATVIGAGIAFASSGGGDGGGDGSPSSP
jgi:hypothetical protein